MTSNQEQYCLINDEKTVQEIKNEVTKLKNRWDSDMGTIKTDLNRLILFINDVSQRYDNIDPILSSFTEKLDNINKLQEKNYKNKIITYLSQRKKKVLLVSGAVCLVSIKLFK